MFCLVLGLLVVNCPELVNYFLFFSNGIKAISGLTGGTSFYLMLFESFFVAVLFLMAKPCVI